MGRQAVTLALVLQGTKDNNMRKKMGVPLFLLLFILSPSAGGWCGYEPGSGIQGSKHDLIFDAEGTGEAAVCVPCHRFLVGGKAKEPFAFPGLDQTDLGSTLNKSQSKKAVVIDSLIGPSRACLACHDGVIATDSLYPLVNVAGLGRDVDPDLNRHHPIGIDYVAISGERKDLNPPSTEWINGSATRTIGDSLYGGTIMTCATCHDIHNNFTSAVSYPAPNYYTYTNKKDLCLTCHLSW